MVVTQNEREQGFGPLTAEDILEFDSLFQDFLQDSVHLNDAQSGSMDSMRGWMLKAVEYNVQKGDNFRRLLAPMAYKSFVQNPSKENMRLAFLLGWVLEMYHASGFMADDFMDNTSMREDKPSWDKFEGIGSLAVNDSLMLRLGSLKLLTKYFGDQSYYPKMYHLLRQSSDKWSIGRLISQQCLKSDETWANIQDSLSLDRYSNIMKYKTTCNILSLPINLAMIMAGEDLEVDSDSLGQLKEVLIDIGHYLQVREDFLEVFGLSADWNDEARRLIDHIRTGWVSKEWSWVIVQAAQKCTPDKFEELMKMREMTDAENSKMIQGEYELLGIKEAYVENQNECIGDIMRKIEEMPANDHKNFLMVLMSN